MYSFALFTHSWFRWIVLVLAIAAVVRGVRGNASRRAWTAADRRANMLATIALDVQMLLGLWLYVFLSPFTTQAFQDFGAAMRTSGLRYWTVEHTTMMIAAVVLAHVGNAAARKAVTDQARHYRTALFFGLVVLLLLFGIPWPGLPNGRPIFRFAF